MSKNTYEKLKQLFKSEAVEYSESSPPGKTDLLAALRALVPQRLCDYDPECIDEPDDYERVLKIYARSTCGEFEPTDITVVQDGNDIKVGFRIDGEPEEISFSCDESFGYVSDEFVGKLNEFLMSRLSARFLQVSGTDNISVYLPTAVASAMETGVIGVQNAQTIIDFLLEGNSIERIPWNKVSAEVKNGMGRDGETICTALVKHRGDRAAADLEYIINVVEEGPDIAKQNRYGETPLGLATKAGNWSVVQVLHWCLEYKGQRLQTIGGTAYFRETCFSRLIELAEPCLGEVFFYHIGRNLLIGRSETFYVGEDVLTIFMPRQDTQAGEPALFDMSYQMSGRPEKGFDRVVELKEAADIVCRYARQFSE